MSNPARPEASGAELRTRARRFKPVVLEVSDATIKASMPKDSGHCMLADSLKLMFPGCFPSVDLATMRYTDKTLGLRLTFLTPPNAQDALIKFDRGEPIEPFTVRLAKPILIQPTGAKKKLPNGETVRTSRRREGVAFPNGGQRSVPALVGGPPMPNGPLANTKGRIRAYGLRQSQA